jgi:hypothetical protein
MGSKHATPVFLAAASIACSSGGLSGEYHDQRGVTRYEFERNGRVFISVMGTTTAARYTLEDNRVLIDGMDGVIVFRRVGDELSGPLGITLTHVATERHSSVPTDSHE